MAERILMNEYKSLAQEDWVNIDVCLYTAPWYSVPILDPNSASFKMKTCSIGKSA